MTAPPLPASPCLRVQLDYTQTDGFDAGSRFYLSYAGSAPTAANCATLASDIAAAWATDMAPGIDDAFSLTHIDVLDIATLSGLSGQWNGTEAGTNGGVSMPSQCAMNVEFAIARRYRGGKPRMFWPPGNMADTQDAGHWSADYITSFGTAVTAFFTAVNALSVGAVGTLHHVNLSYYSGFTNITNSSGRERAVPKYRAAALLDSITGYNPKAVIGSQKRRRTATTP